MFTWICRLLFAGKYFIFFFFVSFVAAEERLFHPAVTEGFNIWVGFDVVYWQPLEKAVVATNKVSNVFFTDNFTLASAVHPNFQWSAGYRLSGGYIFSKNLLWDLEGDFLHYSSHALYHQATGSSFAGMFPVWSLSSDVLAGDYVFESIFRWNWNLNMADLQTGRCFSFSDRLELEPFFGLRSLWLHQDGHVVYKGGIFLIGITAPEVSINGTDYIKLQNNYWGVGPRIGAKGLLRLKKGVGISALAAIAAPYGYFHVRQKECYLDTIRFFYRNQKNRFGCVGDFSGGLFWKTPFLPKNYALTFKTEWEYHLFFDQFQLKRDAFGVIPSNKNFSTQGVTFSGRLDF